jgi:NADH-quinone oxidoreductase subunit N
MNAIIFSAIWGVLMMFSGIFIKTKAVIRNLAITGAAILLLLNIAELSYHFILFHVNTRGMLVFDSFGLLFNTIAFAAALIYLLASARDIEDVGVNQADYLALIFFVLCGVSIASSFNTLLMLFLSIEIISIPLYILTGSDKRNLKSNEASLKYFLMGSFSTGIMLMGIALIYGATGSFALGNMSRQIIGFEPVLMAGLLLLLISMSFKVSAAPFHFWTPDVYDGAPTVFTSFMATIVKAAIFIAFVRLFDAAYGQALPKWRLTIAFIVAATLFIGNITAVFQQSVKRMLAYSSIAQAGFMFFALFGYNEYSKDGIILYSAAYSLATIGIFAILIKMKDYTFDGYNGLAKQQPLLAAVNTIFLLSLAGIPATAGFFAKYYMLVAAVRNGTYLWLVIFAVLCAAVSAYYYFRVIQAMYFKDGDGQVKEASPAFKTILVIVAGLIIILGLFPQLLTVHLYF